MTTHMIGACGLFWEADAYQWNSYKTRRLLGERTISTKAKQVVDFSMARGIYVLYDESGVYYAGMAMGATQGFTGRIADHMLGDDHHAGKWSRFSWFAFDSPSDDSFTWDGIRSVDQWDEYEELTVRDAVVETEAILIAALNPPGNKSRGPIPALEWKQFTASPGN